MALILPRSVFVHIPKTAGQWVAQALERAGLIVAEIGPVHATPSELEADPRFRTREVRFTFVRDPVAWYPSMWTHRMQERWSPIDDRDWFSDAWIARWETFTAWSRSDSFEDFVGRCADHWPDGWVSDLYTAYTDGVTHVGKQERAAEDLIAILEIAGEDFDRDLVRETQGRNVRASAGGRDPMRLYSAASLALVKRMEIRARTTFGYLEEVLDAAASLALGVPHDNPLR